MLASGLRVMFTSSHGAPVSRPWGAIWAGCFGCLLLIGASLLWPPTGLYAQTEAEAPDKATEQQAGAEPVAPEQEEAEQSDPIPVDLDKPPSRFIPSEEISEDFSVPFPVDI